MSRVDSPRAYISTASASSSSVRPRMISRNRERKGTARSTQDIRSADNTSTTRGLSNRSSKLSLAQRGGKTVRVGQRPDCLLGVADLLSDGTGIVEKSERQ